MRHPVHLLKSNDTVFSLNAVLIMINKTITNVMVNNVYRLPIPIDGQNIFLLQQFTGCEFARRRKIIHYILHRTPRKSDLFHGTFFLSIRMYIIMYTLYVILLYSFASFKPKDIKCNLAKRVFFFFFTKTLCFFQHCNT